MRCLAGAPLRVCVLQVTSQVAWDDQKWASLVLNDNFAVILTGVLPVYVAGIYDFWTNSGACRFILLLLFHFAASYTQASVRMRRWENM